MKNFFFAKRVVIQRNMLPREMIDPCTCSRSDCVGL